MSGQPHRLLRLAALLAWFIAAPLLAASPDLVPPPEPAVRPLIAEAYPQDTNLDRIADGLVQQAGQAAAKLGRAVTAAEQTAAQVLLDQAVDVELVFNRQVTQEQINAFLDLGGEISHLYRSVSYGWNGRIPLSQVQNLPAVLGGSLVLVDAPLPAKLHLDTATRTGRVRPIWVDGFAGSSTGYAGTTNITIAVVDTGADESHTDLNGRRVYWKDFTTDGAVSPIDMVQHGSHVMGIATGTGAASGSGTGTLKFTDENTLSGVPSGSFYPSGFELPGASVTMTLTSRWNGGGSTTLYLLYSTKGTAGSYTAQALTNGTSPLTLTTTFTPLTTRLYSPGLVQRTPATITTYFTTCQVANDPGVGDGFNRLRGVAPGCNWACAKVFTSAGSGIMSWTAAAIDDLVANRVADRIKVMNLSLGAVGSPGLDTTTRQKINTAVNNGIVVAVSAGNDGGTQQVDDPGRAAMALTVAAANDVSQLTDYTSEGFASPSSTAGQEEDYKPDLMAPGGSLSYYSAILSVDSNSGDGSAFADQQANDYYNISGTSMASPFVAGCAALVIEALEKQGTNWDFNSSQHSRYVKMLLCATASESNTSREGNTANPTLQRADAGPSGFPAGKDQYEGYGMINPDAAIEAVATRLSGVASATLGPGTTDRRVWATSVSLTSGQAFQPQLTVPGTGDFDLYLYSATPSAYGTPVMLAASTGAGTGVGESLSFTPSSNTNALLVVKRVSGSGTFSLMAPVFLAGTVRYYPTNYPASHPSTKTVGDVTLDLTGDHDLSALTTGGGLFTLTGVPFGGDYCVAPVKTNDSPNLNGVTSFDLALIQRHILNLTPLDSPYKRLAADANGSGTITSFDLALIQRLILNLTNNLPAGLWRFVPTNYVFPNPLSPWSAPTNLCYTGLNLSVTTQDFVAIKLGDVNNSWVDNSARPELVESSAVVSLQGEQPKSATRVMFQISNQSAAQGETVTVALLVSGFERVTSAQFTLQWDPAVLSYSGVSDFGLPGLSAGNFGSSLAENGRLTFVWFDPRSEGATLADGRRVFTLRFVVSGQPGSVSPLRLVSSPTAREASIAFEPAVIPSSGGQINVLGARPVQLSLVDHAGGVIKLSVPTAIGRQYVLECADGLPATHWTALQSLAGDGTLRILTDSSATNQQRFYRVRIE